MFNGSIVAVVTPMTASGEIDERAFLQLLEWHASSGTDGVVVLGTTGESPTVTASERRRLVECAVSTLRGRLPVIVGTGTNATAESIVRTTDAMKWGADAALLVTPYYNKPTQEGLYQHYKAIADAVPLPQILYNVPTRTGCDLLPETVARLASLPSIVGLKEATGNMERLAAVRALVGDQLDLLSGDDGTALSFMQGGGKGVISVVANVVPRVFADMCHAALAGDWERAESLDKPMRSLYKILFCEANPIPTKWALMKMGRLQGGIRLPLTPLSAGFHAAVLAALAEADGTQCVGTDESRVGL